MLVFLAFLLVAIAWIGHACILTAQLNYVYARPWPKVVLRPWRYVTGALILAFPLILSGTPNNDYWNMVDRRSPDPINGILGRVLLAYASVCFVFGAAVLPVITLSRQWRKPPVCVLSESTRTLDVWPELGEKLIGDGKGRAVTRLPGNGVFKFDLTDLTLALPNLPPEWDGLRILLLSDLHFHGTPSRVYFDRILDELAVGPVPDLVCLAGDFVDTDTHRAWIQPLLGRLQAKEAKLAILGNHDKHHDPDGIRAELAAAGYTVLSNTWREISVRGVPCVAIGHEGPWLPSPPDLSGAPGGAFRLCLSHTPDNFYWGIANGIGLMLCGHVHGGAIRVPVIGSIFVPSVYGRRFDMGVFAKGDAVMAVSRGVSGKEPLRFRCNPQAIRITLKQVPGSEFQVPG